MGTPSSVPVPLPPQRLSVISPLGPLLFRRRHDTGGVGGHRLSEDPEGSRNSFLVVLVVPSDFGDLTLSFTPLKYLTLTSRVISTENFQRFL